MKYLLLVCNDLKMAKILSKFSGRKTDCIGRKAKIQNQYKEISLKYFRRHDALEMEFLSNKLNTHKNEGLLRFDGTEDRNPSFQQDVPEYVESTNNIETESQLQEKITSATSLENESGENISEVPNAKNANDPASLPTLEASSEHFVDLLNTIERKLSNYLSIKPKGCIKDLKETMRGKLYRQIFSEEYLLEQISQYQDFKQKKKEAIVRQAKTINRMQTKRTKKRTPLRKYFYVVKKKEPAWKDEIESSGTSVTELNTEVEEPEELSTESKGEYQPEKEALEKQTEDQVCDKSDKSISCPSETDSEAPCKCNTHNCVCNEYARFHKFLSKKYEYDEIEVAEKTSQLTKENVDRWDDLCNLDEASHWSEETILEVTSTSSSSCGAVRMCHCSHCNCGCEEYREYLKYKLHQAARRRRKRNDRRAEKVGTLQRIIEENYKEDEYNRTVREFINEYYVKPGEEGGEQPNVCSCGLYNCDCSRTSMKEQTKDKGKENEVPERKRRIDIDEESNKKTEQETNLEDEKRKVRFGSQDSTGAVIINPSGSMSVPSQKSMSSNGNGNSTKAVLRAWEAMEKRVSEATSTQLDAEEKDEDIYGAISHLLEKSDTILKFDINDYIDSETEPERKASESDASSYGSFDYKKYLVDNECNCEDYLKYINYKKKTRRLAEKADPLLKYLRKRLLFVANMYKAEKLLDHTSSETDSPVRVPEMKICQKYNLDAANIERKRKIIRKKNRKLEKRAVLDIIKKGNHLCSCDCNVPGKKHQLEFAICEKCQVHMKIGKKTLKTKIEPSIPLGEIDEKDCVLGKKRTFPECTICKEILPRIQFTGKVEHRIIPDDDEFGKSFDMAKEGEGRALLNQGDEGKVASPSDPKFPGQSEGEPKRGSKLKITTTGGGKGGKGKGKKGKCKKGKKKGDKKKKKKKCAGKNKKHKPKQVYYYVQRLSTIPEKGLDVAVSIFDPRVLFKSI